MLLGVSVQEISFSAPGADTPLWPPKGLQQMTSIFGMALLPLWIMGAPLIGALISLALPAPRTNTMPRARHRKDDVIASTAYPRA